MVDQESHYCRYLDGSIFYTETPSQYQADGSSGCPNTQTLLAGTATAPPKATAYCLSAAWLKHGGVFAIACVRGGGEYGERWHRAGMLGNKQNVFDDFAAAAEMLIARGYASHETLAAYGYSGGGLLVGATEVQHPELFAAVAEEAGPVDVLRGYTYGSEAVWADEVGSPVASAQQFEWLYKYAPLVAIRKGVDYPATLVMTSENDARVSPAHSYKFAAQLQWAQAGGKPVLLYVAANRGHIAGSRETMIDTLADTEAFLFHFAQKRAAF
ncbi:MAG TPA: prolyl oligopeptidase family serine peptidase [Candidatus Cybelea sp.]|jgi:prolyl oligopeptidase|nr:prolyl oligopeptidase family serine peptidase [Candidatus Cybelea sp.]